MRRGAWQLQSIASQSDTAEQLTQRKASVSVSLSLQQLAPILSSGGSQESLLPAGGWGDCLGHLLPARAWRSGVRLPGAAGARG